MNSMKYRIPQQAMQAESPTGPFQVRPFQVALPIDLWAGDLASPRVPVILDTGHSHSFSIRREQDRDWIKASLKQT